MSLETRIQKLLNEKEKIDKQLNELYKIQSTCCNICCDNIEYEYKLQCCDVVICYKCIFEHVKIICEDIQFKAIKCPFCNVLLPFGVISKICRKYKKKELSDKYRIGFKQLVNYKRSSDLLKIDDILNKDKYYGFCMDCPELVNIPKVCANGDGDLVVLRKEMFICNRHTKERLKSAEYEALPYKKCPHCGVLGKPNPGQCNYLYCGDHRWCYVCQARLPLDNNGHNVHYYVGNGSSAYDFDCRITKNNGIRPTFVLEMCDCSSCSPRQGKALCLNENCNNLCDQFKCVQCI